MLKRANALARGDRLTSIGGTSYSVPMEIMNVEPIPGKRTKFTFRTRGIIGERIVSNRTDVEVL